MEMLTKLSGLGALVLVGLWGCGGSCGSADYAGTEGDEFCNRLMQVEEEGYALAELTWAGPGEDCGCLLTANLLDGGGALQLPQQPMCMEQRCGDAPQTCLGALDSSFLVGVEAVQWPGCWLTAKDSGTYLFPKTEGGEVEVSRAQLLVVVDDWAQGFKATLEGNKSCAHGMLRAGVDLPLPGNCTVKAGTLKCRALTVCESTWLGPLEAF